MKVKLAVFQGVILVLNSTKLIYIFYSGMSHKFNANYILTAMATPSSPAYPNRCQR